MKIVFPSQKSFFGLFAPTAAAALFLAASASDARAGSFGGPPPFRDGSPLISGVDGSYQAIARAKNITGVFRFQYQNGVQTSGTAANGWVFFIDGRPQRGGVTAAINGSSIAGVLDGGSANFATNTNGTLQLPVVLVNQSAQSAGEYNGKLQLNNPYGTFSGTGRMNPAPPQTNEYVIIGTNAGGGLVAGSITVTNGGSVGVVNTFKFKGVRTTVSTPTITATPTPVQ